MPHLPGTLKAIRDIMWQDTGLNGDAQRIEQLGWMLFFKIFSDKDQELELLDDAYRSPIPESLHWAAWAADDEGLTGDDLLAFVEQRLFPTLRNLDVRHNRRALLLREVFTGNNNYMKSGTNLRKVLNKLNEIDFNVSSDRHQFGDLYENILKDLQSAGKSGEFYTPRAVTQFVTDMVNPRLGERVLDPACGTGGYLTSAIEHLKAQATSVDARQRIQDDVMGWEYKPLPFLLATTNLILHDVEVPNIRFGDTLGREYTSYRDADRVDVVLANPPFGGIVANGYEGNFPVQFRTRESADLFLVLIVHLLRQGGRAGLVLPDGSLTGEGVKQRVRKRLLETCDLHTIVRLPNSVFQPYATVATNLLFFEKKLGPVLPTAASGPLFDGADDGPDPSRYATRTVWYYEHRLPEGQKSYSKTKTIQRREFDPIAEWWHNRQESDVAWRVPIETLVARGFDLDIKNPNRREETTEHTSAELLDQLAESFGRSSALLRAIGEELGAPAEVN